MPFHVRIPRVCGALFGCSFDAMPYEVGKHTRLLCGTIQLEFFFFFQAPNSIRKQIRSQTDTLLLRFVCLVERKLH